MKKISLKKVFGMKSFLIILVGFLILFGFNFFKEYSRNRQLNAQIKKLEVMAKGLEAQNLDILSLAKYLDTEEFLEVEARTKLGLKKTGETTVVVNIPGMEEGATSTQPNPIKKTPNIKQWWKYFFEK